MSGVAEELEELAPGPELAALLGSVDRDALSDRDRVRLVRARNRLSAHVQAELMADLYGVVRAEPPDEQADLDMRSEQDCPYPWAQTELSFGLRWTYTAVSARLEQARRLLEDLPQVYAALSEGRIDMPKALLFLDMLWMLELPVARRIADRLLEQAEELTTGQLRARLRRLVIAADPQLAAKRAKAAIKGRRVATHLDDNGLAGIAGYELAPHRVAAGWERVNAIAKAAKAAGDPRRIDELRADALMDLLIGEGIAAGGPITNGDIEEPPEPTTTDTGTSTSDGSTSEDQTVQDRHLDDTDRSASETSSADGDASRNRVARALGITPTGAHTTNAGTSWPTAPADASLLDPKADPPMVHPAGPPAEETSLLPPEPPPEQQHGDQTADPDHERLRPYWLAGFDQLATTRPGGCPHCGQAGNPGPMPGPRRGTLDLQMALSTLMHLDELPAELAGFGPLLADIARQVAEQCPDLQWRFSVYNELDSLIAHGITKARPIPTPTNPDGRRTKRRPSAEVAAFVRARNRTCIAVGCRRPSTRCELDHTLAWGEHGESEPDNLDPGCTRHHRFKHSDGCQLVHFSGGVFGWQTPLGLQYMTRPDPPLYDDLEIVEPCQPADAEGVDRGSSDEDPPPSVPGG